MVLDAFLLLWTRQNYDDIWFRASCVLADMRFVVLLKEECLQLFDFYHTCLGIGAQDWNGTVDENFLDNSR